MTSKPKSTVVQILPALTTGGVERGTIELSKELIEKDFRPLIISEEGDPQEVSIFKFVHSHSKP